MTPLSGRMSIVGIAWLRGVAVAERSDGFVVCLLVLASGRDRLCTDADDLCRSAGGDPCGGAAHCRRDALLPLGTRVSRCVPRDRSRLRCDFGQSAVGDAATDFSKEYFSNIDPLYRSYGKQEALRKQTDYFADRSLERDWLKYNAGFANDAHWMKQAGNPFGDPDGECQEPKPLRCRPRPGKRTAPS